MKSIYLLTALFFGLILGCGTPKNLAEVQLKREPYLQMAFKDRISVLWQTDMGTDSELRYGTTKGLENRRMGVVEKDGNIHRHEVRLLGLQPGTKYYYAIYSNGKRLAGGDAYFFKTEPADAYAPFSFFAMGDIGEPVADGGFPEVTSYQIANREEKVDFGIGLGDIIYPDGESKFADEYLFKPMQVVLKNTPFYPALGNHDWHVNPDKNFVKEWQLPNNEHYYSFDYANAHFIALDTREGDLYDAEAQIAWFEADLKAVQGKYDWIFVYFHHNGRTCTYKEDYKAVMDLYPLFAKYQVDLVLNGHAHTYERLHPFDAQGEVLEKYRGNTDTYPAIGNGFIQITTGAGGKLKSGWAPGKCDENIQAKAAHTGHFSVIKIEGKKLEFQVIASMGGAVLDRFVMEK
ncbi:MAG: metallophosphoesterase family protein [Flavobacteriaceae bacterium]|nr:metallophosphoesterase family protein [Flavobacteriaceae bacterium]